MKLIAQPRADIGEAGIAGCVGAGRRRKEILAGALGDDDDGVSAAPEPLGEHVDHPAAALQRERDLGDEAEVHIGSGQGGVGRDEAGVSTHQLHQADPVQRAARLGVGGEDRPGRRFHCRGEPETALDPVQVVVDRLGNTHHGETQSPADRLGGDGRRPTQCAVAADAEQHRHAVSHQRVDHHRGVLRTPRRGEDGSAVGVHVRNDVSGQLERRVLVRIGEPGEAVAVAEDAAHAVAVTQREGQRPEYVVEPGAQPAARDHRRRHVAGFEGEPAPGPGLLERGWRASVLEIRSQVASVRRAQHRRSVIDELRQAL